MGITERKARERARRRESIIDAAEKVILENGFEETTMDEIAEGAELSKGTLYLYFENKNEIYLAICQRGSQLLNTRFAEIVTRNEKGLELIRMIGEAYLDFVTNEPLYFQAFLFYEGLQKEEFLEKSSLADTCEKNSEEAFSFMTQALEIGMEDGSIDPAYDAEELAIMIWASSKGIVNLAHWKNRDHHFKWLDSINIKIESMYTTFIKLLANGMASKS